jgi:AcrR family transcriptional regulator
MADSVPPLADESAAEQRERILQAAYQVFRELGYQDTRVQDVIARARVSRRTLYEHFRDIEALRRAVAQMAVTKTITYLATMSQEGGPPDRLRACLASLFESAAGNRELARLLVDDVRDEDGKTHAFRDQLRAFFVSVLVQGCRDDYERGLIPSEPDEIACRALVAMAEGLAIWFVESGDTASVGAAVECVLKMWRRMVPWYGNEP